LYAHHLQQVWRTCQTPGMGGENALGAALHSLPSSYEVYAHIARLTFPTTFELRSMTLPAVAGAGLRVHFSTLFSPCIATHPHTRRIHYGEQHFVAARMRGNTGVTQPSLPPL